MSATTVFFSWQSDTSTRDGRNFIEKALKEATDRISQEITLDEPEREPIIIDRDTLDVPGYPAIFGALLDKIERAAVFVPDLTFVSSRPNGHPSPNPNVLIEYGYALKALTDDRIVAVMNCAYGKPTRETMPFDLSHRRFPITYDLGADASDEVRRRERATLSKKLEHAIRLVLESDTYRSIVSAKQLPISYRQPLQGRARFRPPGEPIGFYDNPIKSLMGQAESPVTFSDGPALWLRVIPQKPLPETLKIADIRKLLAELSLVPLYKTYSNNYFVRGKDGAGLFALLDSDSAPVLIFVFTDGEIWVIDTYPFEAYPKLILLDEDAFAKSLQSCSTFLSESFGIKGPFHWIVGIEGVAGRVLPIPNDRMGRTRGPCASDLIEQEGSFRLGEDPFDALEPFFAKICDQCGVSRRPRNTTASNS